MLLLEIIVVIAELALALLWLLDGNGNYEPYFIMLGVVLFLIDVKRRAKESAKNGGGSSKAENSTKKDELIKMILKSDPGRDWSVHADGLKTVAVYNNDANLRLEISYDDDGVQCDNFQEPWATKHHDKRAVGYWCRLYYGSTHIAKYILVSVDGGRAMIPPPELSSSLEFPKPIQPLNYKIAKIFDRNDSLNEYIKRSGLSVDGGIS